ncbi:unnamed protein product, partial [Discosporangium mesarthrocarpum]
MLMECLSPLDVRDIEASLGLFTKGVMDQADCNRALELVSLISQGEGEGEGRHRRELFPATSTLNLTLTLPSTTA